MKNQLAYLLLYAETKLSFIIESLRQSVIYQMTDEKLQQNFEAGTETVP